MKPLFVKTPVGFGIHALVKQVAEYLGRELVVVRNTATSIPAPNPNTVLFLDELHTFAPDIIRNTEFTGNARVFATGDFNALDAEVKERFEVFTGA